MTIDAPKDDGGFTLGIDSEAYWQDAIEEGLTEKQEVMQRFSLWLASKSASPLIPVDPSLFESFERCEAMGWSLQLILQAHMNSASDLPVGRRQIKWPRWASRK